MRYVILVLLIISTASLHKQSLEVRSEMIERRSFSSANLTSLERNRTKTTPDVLLIRLKRSAGKASLRHEKKMERRKAKRLKLKRYLRKEMRKAEKDALLQRKGILDSKRKSREGDLMTSHEITQERQNELLASVDDLPKRSTTVEISVKDPALCKVDGVAMCKHGGECMSRVSCASGCYFSALPMLFVRSAVCAMPHCLSHRVLQWTISCFVNFRQILTYLPLCRRCRWLSLVARSGRGRRSGVFLRVPACLGRRLLPRAARPVLGRPARLRLHVPLSARRTQPPGRLHVRLSRATRLGTPLR